MTSEEIIRILKEKNATLPCPACGHDGFTLLDGDFTKEFIAAPTSALGNKAPFSALGIGVGPSRRSFNYIMLVCDNCGYLRQHAAKPLGITPKYRRG